MSRLGPAAAALIAAVLYSAGPAGATDWLLEQQRNAAERAAYWSERGYRFDPRLMSA